MSVERYRQSDVNFWGMVAIVASGLAVATSSLPALLPAQVFTFFHASWMDGADINSLRAELATLSSETAALKLDTTEMLTRIGLAERNRGDIVQRVGALENTLPFLVEQIPPGTPIDASIVTSSIGDNAETSRIPGGSVEIARTPLYPSETSTLNPVSGALPMPGTTVKTPVHVEGLDLERVDTDAFGIAMGRTVTVDDAYVTWIDLRNKIGALLIGMDPILSGDHADYHIVAGPIDRIARAEELCGYITRAGLQCLPVPYTGYRMPQ